MSEGDSHESDILFCPFCGDVDALEVQHLEGAILYPAYRVACDNCGAAFAIRSDIDEWNRRALPAVQPDAAVLHMTITGLNITVVKSGTVVGKDDEGNDMLVTDETTVFNGWRAWVTQKVYDALKGDSRE